MKTCACIGLSAVLIVALAFGGLSLAGCEETTAPKAQSEQQPKAGCACPKSAEPKSCPACSEAGCACPKPGQVVNARCPMMGTTLDPANVPEKLTRMHKGRKVGFCCAGCPAAWDKLSNDQKDAKLSEAK